MGNRLPDRIRAPIRGVGLDEAELVGRELAELQQDRIRDADLPDVVQGGRAADELHLGLRQAELFGEQGGHLAHPVRMLAGVVVAELGRPREPLDDLGLRRLQLARALAHLGLEQLVVVLDLQVQEPRFEQRADPQQHLVGVKRLADEVLCPPRQGFALGFLTEVARQHQNGQVGGLRDLAQAVEQPQTVDMRHVEIEQDQVRPEPDVHRPRLRADRTCSRGVRIRRGSSPGAAAPHWAFRHRRSGCARA